MLALVLSLIACNPYACLAKSRFSEFRGLLNGDSPPSPTLSVRDPGVVFVQLGEQKGAGSQQIVGLSLNVWGFADSVESVQLRQKSGSAAGRLLFSTSSGYLVRDSVWNGYPVPYGGPLSWDDFWDTMNDGNAYVELHPANGKPVIKGIIGLLSSSNFQPSCTD